MHYGSVLPSTQPFDGPAIFFKEHLERRSLKIVSITISIKNRTARRFEGLKRVSYSVFIFHYLKSGQMKRQILDSMG